MHRVRSSLMLLGVALAVMMGLFIASSRSGTERAFAGATDFTGTYDVVVHSGNVGLFHCVSSLTHNTATNAVTSRLQCYTTTPGLAPGSPLVGTAAWPDITVAAAPPSPPPYTTAAPQDQSGTATDATMTLSGCFEDVGGTLGPNVITVATFNNPGTDISDGVLSGTVDIFFNQSNTDCTNATPEVGDTPALDDQPVDLHKTGTAGEAVWRLGSSTDYDGDGCTDAQELTNPPPASCGDDPYNPNDSNATDFSGPVSITATSIRSDWDTTAEKLIPGSYFHCLGYTAHTNIGTTDDITTTTTCYTDSKAIAGASGSGLPASGDGLSGAPPPWVAPRANAAFTSADPTANSGSYNSGTNDITTTGCFAEVGPPLGPNVMTVAVIDAHTGHGSVDIYFGQTNAACTGGTPLGNPALTADLDVARQDAGNDSDGDGCTDQQEVTGAANCGDDPYNKWDGDGLSDMALSGVYSLSFGGGATLGADRDDTENTGGDSGGANSCFDKIDNGGGDGADGADPDDCKVILGQYSHCIFDATFVGGAMTAPAVCYTDASGLGSPGDGLPGAPPPNAPDTNPTSYVNINTARRVITGTLSGSTLTTTDCFEHVEIPANSGTFKDIGTVASLNAYTGHGTGDITFYDDTPGACTTNPVQVFTGAPIDIAPQGPRYGATAPNPATLPSVDSDQDGCRDDLEVRAATTQSTGGRRDPYNRWDFADQYIGSPLAKDNTIAVGDIGAVVKRFGTNDAAHTALVNWLSDPNQVPAAATGYHPSADRNGSIVGANGWNLKPPDGTIAVGDIGAVVAQFGHSCS